MFLCNNPIIDYASAIQDINTVIPDAGPLNKGAGLRYVGWSCHSLLIIIGYQVGAACQRRTQGEEHKRIFTVAVYLNGEELGTASGSRKKVAEALAAQKALEKIC